MVCTRLQGGRLATLRWAVTTQKLRTLADRIALNFLPITPENFEFTVHRKPLNQASAMVPGERWLRPNPTGAPDANNEPRRYEIALAPHPDFESVVLPAWANPNLTVQCLREALAVRVSRDDLRGHVEISRDLVRRRFGFTLVEHGIGIREVMWVRPFALRSAGRFGILLRFALRIDDGAEIDDRRRGELSLSYKNGHVNENYYLDHSEKITLFLSKFYSALKQITLHDGTTAEIERKLLTLPSHQLKNRTYIFGNGKEHTSQFFGLREYGPYSAPTEHARLGFFYRKEDRELSQDLFRALRGDTYSTFLGMDRMFKTAIDRSNVVGIEVESFEPKDLDLACEALARDAKNAKPLPIAVVPFSKNKSEQDTANYSRAKHTVLSKRWPCQFVDRAKTLGDRNALKWSVSNIALAVFAKMGGVPWRVRATTLNGLIIGIGQAHVVRDNKIDRYVAYSVLTDTSGQYEAIRILGASSDRDEYLSNLKKNLRAVLSDHGDQYQSFVVHASFNLRRDEMTAIGELLEEFESKPDQKAEFVVLKFNDKNDFFGFAVDHNSRIPTEGTIVQVSRSEFVVWFSGLGMSDRKVPKKPERPVHIQVAYPLDPSPKLETIQRLLQDAYNIAGANWRGFNAKSFPISVYYAKLIADQYARFRAAGLEDVDIDNLSPWFL